MSVSLIWWRCSWFGSVVVFVLVVGVLAGSVVMLIHQWM